MRRALRRADRALFHLLTGAGLSIVCSLALGLVLVALACCLLVVGAGMLPEAARTVRSLTGAERRRTEGWSGQPVPARYLPLDEGPLRARVRNAVRDPGTYRDLLWLVAHLGCGLVLFYAAMALFPLALLVDGVWCGLARRRPVLLPLLPGLAGAQARLSRTLLSPSPRATLLSERVEELTATRAGALVAHGAELRRIERDLHDGTQARLVALAMRIGLARRACDRDPEAVRTLLDDAQDQAEEALADLRHVVRGIHPPVLTDRGLVGAVRALAAGSGLEVSVRAAGPQDGPEDDGTRAPAAVEAAAYFVVAEALSNAARHSGARRASVELARTPRLLRVRVRDEGRGGADENGGTGLLGIRRRVAALDGTVALSSPAGGPTALEVELPCVW
ncbi:sensor histidine kinase [Streptomyces boncukensis]|uniref:histidine kinase n=1 Tax=Streptomyces boncukensis TaxID=2711219 RepID=A0A6G4WWS4_9ACTN|nr:sensor histidine kinase [Streptomyces boncukensis]NGO69463.1 sensor histidine kinase [Streptomyces boncukensis]